MKPVIINGLIAGFSITLLAACIGPTNSSTGSNELLATSANCNAAWNSATAYYAGAMVSIDNVNYTAAYWSQGQNPSANSGPAGSGQPWVRDAFCR